MKFTIRIWQTTLFVLVAVLSMLSIYFMLLPSIEDSAINITESNLENNVSYLSHNLESDFNGTPVSELRIEEKAKQFINIYDVDLWIYDSNKKLLFRSQTFTDPGLLIREARQKGFEKQSFSYINLDRRIVLASKPVISDDKLAGVVIISDNGSEAVSALKIAQNELNIALFIAIMISIILGLIFSEVIRGQVQKLRRSAFSIAQGNFDLRLKRGLLPYELADLAQTFNVMAEKLGDSFNALLTQQQETLTLINSMAEGVIEVGKDRTVNLANPAAAQLLNKPIEELIGATPENITEYKTFTRNIDHCLKGKEISGVHKFGEKTLLIHGAPIYSLQDDGITGAVLIFTDFTKQKKLEQAQRDFISNAAHELRTPISSLKGYIELLMSGAKDRKEKRESFLKSIDVEINHLHRLVEDLFTLARLDSGISALDIRKNSIAEIIEEVATICHPLAKINKTRLKTKIEGKIQQVICDRDRIIQVLSGFIDNALKHTPAGGAITVFARQNDKFMHIGVTDSGPGIPYDRRQRIFDRFYHRSSTADKKKSTGLGLAIAKEIIEAHGSKINVDSTPSKGATFSFDLKITH